MGDNVARLPGAEVCRSTGDGAGAGRGGRCVLSSELDEGALLDRAFAKRLRGSIRDERHFRRLHQYLTRLGFPPAAIATALKPRYRRAASDE